MRVRARIWKWVILAAVLSGCGSHKINYHGPAADLKYSGKRQLTVAVLDKRPYIINRDKPLDYVGTIRGGYGNPFNQTTAITFSLPSESPVNLSIYNVTGQRIRTLVNTTTPAGFHTVNWNGRDANGRAAASGLYLYRITSNHGTQVRRMVMVR